VASIYAKHQVDTYAHNCLLRPHQDTPPLSPSQLPAIKALTTHTLLFLVRQAGLPLWIPPPIQGEVSL